MILFYFALLTRSWRGTFSDRVHHRGRSGDSEHTSLSNSKDCHQIQAQLKPAPEGGERNWKTSSGCFDSQANSGQRERLDDDSEQFYLLDLFI